MATSPNYAWAEPDNSSLVKNGAADIRTLGDAIDTSVWNVGYGQAGKNKIINGDFSINQRQFTTSSTSAGYTFDRWLFSDNGTGTFTVTPQTFTPGTAPVAGYEGTNFIRSVVDTVGTSTVFRLEQRIEDVRTFAGQTITVSFWAKADANRTLSLRVDQSFGSGGSGAVSSSTFTFAATTAWTRFSQTLTLASISGKTIGAGSYLGCNIFNAVTAGSTMDIWGVQAEYGSKATPFQTASGGSPQAELAMCQRYYWRAVVDGAADRLGVGYVNSTTQANLYTQFPVQMRVGPSALEQSGTATDYSLATASGTVVCSAVPSFNTACTWNASTILDVASGLVAGQGFLGRAVNTNAYLAWSAEL